MKKIKNICLICSFAMVLGACGGSDKPIDNIPTPTESINTGLIKDTEEEKKPQNDYQSSLGLGNEKQDDYETEEETQKPTEIIEEQTDPTYPAEVIIFDHTGVPEKNLDGSSCKAYLESVTLNDFGVMWGRKLSKEDFIGGDFYMVGVKQNPMDFKKGDLQSTGWLISNITSLNTNDAIKFTNLHVIGSLSDSHVALLCSYDWYSAFGMKDTLVVFEDMSGTLNIDDFTEGDIFSAVIFKHNIKIVEVNDYRVIVVEYDIFK